ncbi:MAG: SBBP repeat-containing protein [Verrucomicrobia bacterium]|nr:SBBP repeat-containing protein [Verrucomicrobiota bacterium]
MKRHYCSIPVLFVTLGCLVFETGFAAPPDTWRWRNPLPQGHSLEGVTYGKGIFVAVGEFGTVLTSIDGITWEIQSSGTREELRGVTCGNGLFLAVGGGSFSPTILTSRDGVAWTTQNPGDAKALFGVAYGNGKFVAVGEGAGSLLSSPDGVNWTSARSVGHTYTDTFEGIAFGRGMFVAVGTGGAILTSSDGRIWDRQSPDPSVHLKSVAQSDRGFVAIGARGAILSSSDGANWTRRVSGTDRDLPGIAYANDMYVTLGSSGTILSSSDGINWTPKTSGTSADFTGICYGNGRFVGVGLFGAILTSPDGVNWTSRDSGTRTQLNGLAYGNGLYVAVGASGTVLTSPDAANWKSQVSGTTSDLYGITFGKNVFGNNLFVAVGRNGTMLISPNAVEWASVPSGTIFDLWDIEYGAGAGFVAVGGQGLVTSRDGGTWTRHAVGEYKLLGVGYGNGRFVAVGEPLFAAIGAVVGNSPILTSSDGITWTDRDSGTRDALFDVAFGNGTFVAVGGSILASSDGVSWSRKDSPKTALRGITFGDGSFVAVGDSGTIQTSADGGIWVNRNSGTGRVLNRVAFHDGGFLAVGDLGTILQSDSLAAPFPSLVIAPNIHTNDYTGKITFAISGLPLGQVVAIETYLDDNANGQIDPGEQFVHSVSVADGRLPMVAGVRNLNVPGDEDASTNGVIRTELNLDRRTEIDSIAGHYVFTVATPIPGFVPLLASYTIVPKTLPQGITGTITAADGKTSLAGALVVAVDELESVTGSAFSDFSGRYSLFVPPGTYLLLVSKPGFLFPIDAGSLLSDDRQTGPLLVQVPEKQMLQRNFSMNPADQMITGSLGDLATGRGVPGVLLLAIGTSVRITASSTNETGYIMFGNTDSQGKITLPVVQGTWSMIGLPRSLARLGYLLPTGVVHADTTAGHVTLPEVLLPKFTALIYGTVKGEGGSPMAGIQVFASGSNYHTAASTDSNGNYTLGVFEGEWSLRTEAPGYEEQVAEVRVTNNQAVARDLVMKRAAPTITIQPQSQAVKAGASVSFSVTAAGTPPLSFQWRQNGENLPGATNSTLIINSAQAMHAGTYAVAVSNSAGSVTSSNAVLTVTPGVLEAPSFRFLERIGGTGGDSARGIAADAAGNYYVTGFFADTMVAGDTTFRSSGGEDMLLLKYNSAGSLLWARKAGGTGNDEGLGIAVDASGNCYVTGFFTSTAAFGDSTLTGAGGAEIFVAKYDTAGTLLWARKAGGSADDFANGIAVDAQSNCYVTGNFSRSAIFGNTTLTSTGGSDTFVAKYDSSGNLLWVKQAGGIDGDSGIGIAVDGANNCYVTGRFQSLARFGNFDLRSVGWDIFLVRYDSAGNVLWAKRLGGNQDDEGRGIALDAAGNCYVTGGFAGTGSFGNTTLTSRGATDVFLAKYDRDGTPLWARIAGGSGDDLGYGIAVDLAGNSYITGDFASVATFGNLSPTSRGGQDVFVAKHDNLGNLLWVRQAGGTDDDFGNAVAVDAASRVYLTGEFKGRSAFDETLLVSFGSFDAFVAKLVPAGEIATAPTITGLIPETGAPGTLVTIVGSRFDDAIDVKFGDVSAGFIVVTSGIIGTSVPAGATTGTITVATAGGVATSTNKFTVTASANPPPTVRFTNPAEGQTFSSPANIFVAATAQDPGGAMKRVVFYGNGSSLYDLETGTFSTVNASFTWKDVAAGHYMLVAMATDDQGATTFSSPLRLTVGTGVSVSPILKILKSGNDVGLTWSTNAVGFVLEATPSLSSPPTWTPLITKPTVRGDQNVVVEAFGSGSRFYRLKRAP